MKTKDLVTKNVFFSCLSIVGFLVCLMYIFPKSLDNMLDSFTIHLNIDQVRMMLTSFLFVCDDVNLSY